MVLNHPLCRKGGNRGNGHGQTANGPRAIDAGELARQIANLNNAACLSTDSLQQAMDSARELATSEARILVTGSFYVVGPALRSLELYSRES